MARKSQIARPDSAAGTENENITINVLSNDKGGKFSVQKMDGGGKAAVGDVVGMTPEGAVVKLASLDGSVTVEPGTSFDFLSNGEILETQFTYAVGNGKASVSTATVNLTITGENDLPVLRDDYLTLEWNGSLGHIVNGQVVSEPTFTFAGVSLLTNDIDVDHLDTLWFYTVRPSPDVSYIRIEEGLVNGQVTIIPRDGFVGTLELSYVAGGFGGFGEGTVFIDVPPRPEYFAV